MLEDPKATVYNLLLGVAVDGIDEIQVSPSWPESSNSALPYITFNVPQNVPEYLLDNTIGRQRQIIKIDIWATTPEEASAILISVESAMRQGKFQLALNADIVEPSDDTDSNIHHVTTQFIY